MSISPNYDKSEVQNKVEKFLESAFKRHYHAYLLTIRSQGGDDLSGYLKAVFDDAEADLLREFRYARHRFPAVAYSETPARRKSDFTRELESLMKAAYIVSPEPQWMRKQESRFWFYVDAAHRHAADRQAASAGHSEVRGHEMPSETKPGPPAPEPGSPRRAGKQSVGRTIATTAAFWAVLLLGPLALALWNALSFYRIDEGSLLFLIFSLTAQAISAGIACFVAELVCADEVSVAPMVNAIVAATLMGILLITSAANWQEVISDLLAMAVLIGSALHLRPKRQ